MTHVLYSLGYKVPWPKSRHSLLNLLEMAEARYLWSERPWWRRVWDALRNTPEPLRLTADEWLMVRTHRMKAAALRTMEALAEQYLRDAPGEVE